MQILVDFLPIIIFFVTYKFAGMYAATGAIMVAMAVQIGLQWLRNRTVNKMASWLFLLGEDELRGFVTDNHNYSMYGAPALAKVCERFEFPIPEGEEVQRMIGGEQCVDGCEEGC